MPNFANEMTLVISGVLFFHQNGHFVLETPSSSWQLCSEMDERVIIIEAIQGSNTTLQQQNAKIKYPFEYLVLIDKTFGSDVSCVVSIQGDILFVHRNKQYNAPWMEIHFLQCIKIDHSKNFVSGVDIRGRQQDSSGICEATNQGACSIHLGKIKELCYCRPPWDFGAELSYINRAAISMHVLLAASCGGLPPENSEQFEQKWCTFKAFTAQILFCTLLQL